MSNQYYLRVRIELTTDALLTRHMRRNLLISKRHKTKSRAIRRAIEDIFNVPVLEKEMERFKALPRVDYYRTVPHRISYVVESNGDSVKQRINRFLSQYASLYQRERPMRDFITYAVIRYMLLTKMALAPGKQPIPDDMMGKLKEIERTEQRYREEQ